MERCPGVKERVSSAKRVTGYFATKDYSYRSTQVAGDGWVLVGDAFGFLDPLYSSGVLLALQVGRAGGRRDRARVWRRATPRPRSSASGGRPSTRAWTACAGWCASTTTASASAGSSRASPHLQGTVTDLLIGDLFDRRVDEVWEPMESLYPPDKSGPAPGTPGRRRDQAEDKGNELILPEGRRP